MKLLELDRNKKGHLDNAFFLLLGACLGAYLVATGGVMTYVAYFRDPPIDYDNLGFNMLPNHITGPVLIVLGSLVITMLALLGCWYGCDTVPEFIKRKRNATEYKSLIGDQEGENV